MEKQTKTIELTTEEIKLIEIKREEERLQKEKEDLQIKINNQEKINRTKKEMELFLSKQNFIKKCVEKLFNELPSGKYKIEVGERNQNFKAQTYINSEYVILFEEDLKYNVLSIVHIESKIEIIYEYKELYSKNSYSRKVIGEEVFNVRNGYKEISKNCKSAKTINNKVVEEFQITQLKLKNKTDKKINFDNLIESLSIKYPQAKEIKFTEERKQHWTEEFVTVEFNNGFLLNYKYSFTKDNKFESFVYSKSVGNVDNELLISLLAK